MNYTLSQNGDIQVLKIESLFNELDNQKILSAAFARIAEGFTTFVLDLSKLEFMNSVGLSFMIVLERNVHAQNGKFSIANANAQVLNLLKITKLDKHFTLAENVDEAINTITTNN